MYSIWSENRNKLLLVACKILHFVIPHFISYLSPFLNAVCFPPLYFHISRCYWFSSIFYYEKMQLVFNIFVPSLAVKLLSKIDPKRKFGELCYWSCSSTAVCSGWPVIICSLVRSFGIWYFLYSSPSFPFIEQVLAILNILLKLNSLPHDIPFVLRGCWSQIWQRIMVWLLQVIPYETNFEVLLYLIFC